MLADLWHWRLSWQGNGCGIDIALVVKELRSQVEQMETTLGPYHDMSRRFQEMVGPQMKTLQDAVVAMKPQFDAMAKMASGAAEAMEKAVRTWAPKLNPSKKPAAEEKKPGPDEMH